MAEALKKPSSGAIPGSLPGLRSVRALQLGDLSPSDPGPAPALEWIALSALRINDAYQRSLSDRSVRMIRKIANDWDWARVKALSVADIGDGLYEVLDGQHTAHAAATHGGIHCLPCLVTDKGTVATRAGAFVGINRDRVGMTPLQIFWADVAAGQEDACEALRGVELAGGRVLKGSHGGYPKPGDIMSAVGIVSLAKRGGPAYVRRVVSIGVAARLAPIKDPFLKALAWLIWDDENSLTDEDITNIIRVHTGEALLRRARALREENRRPIPACLATVIKRLAA